MTGKQLKSFNWKSCTNLCLYVSITLMMVSSILIAQTTEVDELRASDFADLDRFGTSVALSGDYALVGAPGEASNGIRAGAAYFFKREANGSWDEVAKVKSSDTERLDRFGFSVDIDGGRAVIGAFEEDTGGNNVGAVYIFELDANGNWSETAKLQASDKEPDDLFGFSVAMSGDVIVVGAYNEDENRTNAGSVYVFEHDGSTTWNEVAKLQASNVQTNASFGYKVATDGNRIVVGAYRQDLPGGLSNAGSAYIFKRDINGSWIEEAILTASDARFNDQFGWAVSIDDDRVAVSTYLKINGNVSSGGVYIYELDANENWTETAILQASDGMRGDYFGWSISISGNRILIGAYFVDTRREDAGAAYIFERGINGSWTEAAKLEADDPEDGDYLGWSVALEGERAIAGATGEGHGPFDPGKAIVFEETDNDTDNPDCDLLSVNSGPPISIDVQFQDTETGLASISIVTVRNATVTIPSFTPGTLAPVVVNAARVDNNKSAFVLFEAFDMAGNSVLCDPVYTTLSSIAPEGFELEQNYPNPFNPSTTIRFGVAEEKANVTLKIFDVNGREILTLMDENMSAGQYSIEWDGRDNSGNEVAGGVYFYRLSSGSFLQTKQMTLIK